MSITAIEDVLIAATKKLLGNKVREVDTLAAEFDTGTLNRLVKNPPACYWAFLGGQKLKGDYETRLDGQFVLYVVTSHASGSKARQRGDKRQIGAYDLLGLLLPEFDNKTIDGHGTMSFKRVQNLFNDSFDKKKVAVYAVSFSLPMAFEQVIDPNLADFITFDADYDIEPFETETEHEKWLEEPADHSTSKPDAEQEITLEQ